MTANAARPEPGTALALLDDVPDEGAAVFDFAAGEARFSLLLARRGDAVFAYENRCPHAAYPLDRHDGRVVVQAGRFIVCAAHFASFELDSGACAGGPCNGAGLARVSVSVDGAWVRMG
jgi:nitrite reductase/ring-hydroxylating ferredoxin subunit